MAIETIPFREIETHTIDMYEATLIMAKRARQIIADRAVEEEFEEIEEDLGLMEERPPELEDYVEPEKAVHMSLREFLNGELEWTYGEAEEDESESGGDLTS